MDGELIDTRAAAARHELERVNAQLSAALRATGAAHLPLTRGAAGEKLETTQRARDAAEAEVARLTATVADLRSRVDYLETALAATESSLSWRITKPLRTFKARWARS